MALSQKALQRKREKKRQARQTKISKTSSVTTPPNPISFSKWSLHECFLPTNLWETGIGHVVISRRSSLGDVAVGMYLIDVFCLGVKDCFIRLLNMGEYKKLLQQVAMNTGELKSVDPVYANTLIHKMIEYSMQLGFKPHGDFSKAQWMLKNIPVDTTQAFIFGKDNKPFYIQGPNESQADVKRIMRTLETNFGQENYHFLLEVQ